MTRLRLTIFLLLILGPHSALFEEEEENEQPANEEDEIEATLTKDICRDVLNRQSDSPLVELCCTAHFDAGVEGIECVAEYTHESANNELNKALHNFANCVFIKKRFTKGNENLNFKRIKADLDRLEDPRERKFMMELYKDCSDRAKYDLKVIRKRLKPGQQPFGMRRPFYALVVLCISTYTERVSCPYFLWQKDQCMKYIKKCRDIMKND